MADQVEYIFEIKLIRRTYENHEHFDYFNYRSRDANSHSLGSRHVSRLRPLRKLRQLPDLLLDEGANHENPFMDARVKDAINRELAAKGWTEVPSGGNVALAAIEITDTKRDVNTVLYEKDLGPNTAKIAKAITGWRPDPRRD
jgi:hypothetical protein